MSQLGDASASRLEWLLASRLGHGGPWPAETFRHLEREARRVASTPDAFLGSIRLGSPEHDALVAASTVVHTQFFRHEAHFEYLREWLVARKNGTRPIRIASIGCATGQEPYSIAWVANEVSVPVTIHACDVNFQCIERARSGFYPARETASLPGNGGRSPWQAPRFEHATLEFAVASIFELPVSFPVAFDLVFCRNLLFYFDPERVDQAWRILERAIAGGGSVVVAPVEALVHVPKGLQREGPLGWLSPSRPGLEPKRKDADRKSRAPRAPLRPSTDARKVPEPTPPRVEARVLESSTRPTEDERLLEDVARFLRSGESERAETVLHGLLARRDDALGWFLLAEAFLERSERTQARVAFERAARATMVPEGVDLESVRRAAVRRARQV